MMFKLGLTGSIGMGKSTTAKMFMKEGCAVWDADVAVHRLYAKSGAAVAPIEQLYPDVVIDGSINRDRLRQLISEDPEVLKKIETIVHPLVALDRQNFISAADAKIGVFDIPLLFETGGDTYMDAIACVYVEAETQKARVLERGTMTEDQFETILAKQIPIAEKRAKSDFVIETDTLEHACAQVQSVVKAIERQIDARSRP
ncbi:MAG: dephospho-CoA kinase [Pseudomonadota bacterium]